MGLRSYLQQKRIVRENQLNSRQKAMKNWSEIRSVLILGSIKTEQDWVKWNKYFANLRTDHRSVFFLGFLIDPKLNIVDIDHHNLVLNHKDVNWLGYIKNNSTIEPVLNRTYDMVLDFNLDHVFLLNWMFVKAKTHLRAGPGNKATMKNYYDLTVNTDEPNTQPKIFLDQIIYFLEKINLSNE
jgi:hypothetical protein